MANIYEKIKSLDNNLREPGYWKVKLLDYFKGYFLDDLTDLNYSTCLTYLITLSEVNKSLFSKEMDLVLESSDVYFLEILISTQKPLITVHFWKYLRKEDGIDKGFITSEKPYLERHNIIYKKILDFINENKLLLMDNQDLNFKIMQDREFVNLYYKYFNQEGEDPLKLPY